MSSAYGLATSYVGQGLLNGFSFFTGGDPSHGFVNYLDKPHAIASGLVSVDRTGAVKLGVDSVNKYSVNDVGRPSVRLTSYAGYTHGLFIADFQHMPASTCGVWPAFWAFNNAQNGANWPAGGEVDIVEGVNTAQKNLYSAHTISGCKLPKSGFTGTQQSTNCSPSASNVGCNYVPPSTDTTSYGDAFNAGGGGVYALQWESDGIKIWHFPRSKVPSNIKTAPDPTKWGTPSALFGGSNCNTDTFFYNMSLVININLCGDYAGNVWGVQDKCNKLAPTCVGYVAANPKAFVNSYWSVNYITVWQKRRLAAPNGNVKKWVEAPEIQADEDIPEDIPTPKFPRNIMRPTPPETRTVTLALASSYATPTPSSYSSTGNKYSVLGCFGSSTGYENWNATAILPTMDHETCVSACGRHKFAGVYKTTCYCADTLGDALPVSYGRCDLPCHGHGDTCGGLVGGSNYNKTMPSGYPKGGKGSPLSGDQLLLTVLRNLGPKGGPAATSTYVDSVTITTAVTVTYTTICATDAAQLVQLQYGTTLTIERPLVTGNSSGLVSVAAATTPLVPMVTRTETCNGCGPKGQNTVTLAVPKAVLTAGPDLVVTAVAVATVVPVNPSGAQKPMKAGASRKGLGVAGVLGWGFAVWLGVFGAIVAL